MLIGKLKRLGGKVSLPLQTALVSRKVEHPPPPHAYGQKSVIFGTLPTLRSKTWYSEVKSGRLDH